MDLPPSCIPAVAGPPPCRQRTGWLLLSALAVASGAWLMRSHWNTDLLVAQHRQPGLPGWLWLLVTVQGDGWVMFAFISALDHGRRALLAVYLRCALLLALPLLPLPLLLIFHADALGHPMFGPLARAAAVPQATLASGLLLAAAFASRWLRAGFAARYGALLFALWFVQAVAPWWAGMLQAPVKEAGLLARQLGEAAVQWQLHRPSLAVYQQAIAPRRAPRPGELALVTLGKGPPASEYDILRERGGIALVRRRGGPNDAENPRAPRADDPARLRP